MNQDQMKGKGTQLKGKLKETWGRLTDDDLALFDGQRDQFLGKLQEKYEGLSPRNGGKADPRDGDALLNCSRKTNRRSFTTPV